MDNNYLKTPTPAITPVKTKGNSNSTSSSKQVENYFKKEPTWPAIIFGIISVFAVLYAIFAPRFSNNSRVAAISVTVIWGILGTLLLWLLWKYQHRVAAWVILAVVLIFLLAFIMFLVGYNYGGLEGVSIDSISGFTRPYNF